MEFILEPYKGASIIRLGEKREKIRKLFNDDYEEFKKSVKSENTVDDFGMFHVFYSKNQLCQAIEFFNESDVVFQNIRLFNKSYSEIKKKFLIKDPEIQSDDSGFTSFKFGIGIFSPFATSEPDEPIESVILFSESYYS